MSSGHIQYGGSEEMDEAHANAHSVMEEHSDSDDDAFSDELSSSPSVPDEDINFEHVYALHNFMATVEGQASVSKGDSLTLLDDSNSYWWLVRVLKTQAVGYIPAENIETPFERLARLNKHRNVDDHAHGAGSAQARTRIGNRPPKPRPARAVPGQNTTRIAFRDENEIFEHSGDDWSESYEGSEEMGDFEGQEGFDEDEEAEDTSEDDDHDERTTQNDHLSLDQQLSQQQELEEAQRRQQLAHQAAMQAQQAAQVTFAAQPAAQPARAPPIVIQTERARSPVAARSQMDTDMLAATGTRKIVLTPPVAQDEDNSSQGHDSVSSPGSPRKLRKANRDDDVASISRQSASPSPSPSSPGADEDGKKKKGGMFSGLFKKKDKKAREGPEDVQRASTPTNSVQTGPRSPVVSPAATIRPAWPDEQRRGDSYLADATRRQQQIEAQNVREGGIRLPSAQMASLTASPGLSPHSSLSSNHASPLVPGRPPRPGSLIGSPSLAGMEVPVLSVTRVFAGTGINSESTFKTVLVNDSTKTTDLVRQAVQRFRLPIDRVDDYYLTVRELGGEESQVPNDQAPMQVFEKLSERGASLPSVRRSSVGSISSVASNLSLNPAIAKLDMHDYSDDSNVKFYLHSRSATENSKPPSSPSLRFALRAVVYPPDMPDGVVFDAQSGSLVLRTPDPSTPHEVKERILFFPANANVAEVIETCLDRFGINGGVVEGGDDVEDKLAKRRSITRVRYCLAAMRSGRRAFRVQAELTHTETILPPGMRILDAYDTSPQLKQSDRSSKEYKRRSADASSLYGAPTDLLPTDPVFVLRNTALIAASRDRLAAAAAHDGPVKRPQPQRAPPTGESIYATPSEELPPTLSKPPAVAIQAQKNAASGVDIRVPDRGTIRSSRNLGKGVRYSYIHEDGTEQDISEIVEAEFGARPAAPRGSDQSTSSHEEFVTPVSSPVGDEDRAAIEALRSTPVTIGDAPRTESRSSNRRDVLEAALTAPTADETLEARINRVLSRVKSGGLSAGIASTLRHGRTSPRATPPMTQHATRPSESTADGQSEDSSDTPTSPRTPAGTSQTSPPTRAGSSRLQRNVLYRDDYGLDVLMALVHAHDHGPLPIRQREPGVDDLFGATVDETTRKWCPTAARSVDVLEARLDELLTTALS